MVVRISPCEFKAKAGHEMTTGGPRAGHYYQRKYRSQAPPSAISALVVDEDQLSSLPT